MAVLKLKDPPSVTVVGTFDSWTCIAVAGPEKISSKIISIVTPKLVNVLLLSLDIF